MPAMPKQIEVVDDAMAEVLRRKSGAERLAIMNGMFISARRWVESQLRREHPEWDEGRLRREVASRLSHGSV